jgi:hypothetical protein
MTDDPGRQDPATDADDADLALEAEELARRKAARPVDPLAGDPPDAVRGSAQTLVDPPGDVADDETLRWDPRTVRAPTREGG